jgi:protein-S-isoprenylcysteine O-methyltransferase Ste14
MNLYAALFRSTDSDSVNRNGVDACLANEPARNKGSEIREHRQKRLPDSTFCLFYLYIICAESFPLPAVSSQEFFRSDFSPWIGVAFCAGGLGLLLWSLISFGRSFRVGIDTDRPDRLITSGIFAISRNPIYVAFAAVLVGQFLIFPNWILLVYTAAATWLFHRQILREEEYLKKHYGAEYANYCRRVRRFL